MKVKFVTNLSAFIKSNNLLAVQCVGGCEADRFLFSSKCDSHLNLSVFRQNPPQIKAFLTRRPFQPHR